MTNIWNKLSRRGFLKGAAGPAAAATASGGAAAAVTGHETFKLTREIPVERGYDIVVAGGGPPGRGSAFLSAHAGNPGGAWIRHRRGRRRTLRSGRGDLRGAPGGQGPAARSHRQHGRHGDQRVG